MAPSSSPPNTAARSWASCCWADAAAEGDAEAQQQQQQQQRDDKEKRLGPDRTSRSGLGGLSSMFDVSKRGNTAGASSNDLEGTMGSVRSSRGSDPLRITRISLPSARSRGGGTKTQLLDLGHIIPTGVILPQEPRYLWWWCVTLTGAFLTAFYEPLAFAFVDFPGLYPFTQAAAAFKYLLLGIFSLDVVVNFFLAYHDSTHQQLVTGLREIRLRYLRFMFWVDLTALLPWDMILMAACGVIDDSSPDDSTLPLYLAILKWISLLRLYRVYHLFVRYMEYNMRMSQLVVTLIRNQTYVLFLLHWQACWWYWIARVNSFSSDTWFASPPFDLYNRTVVQDYVASFYMVAVTFGTVGYGDIHAIATNEFIYIIIIILLNTIVTAYILGTITNLVVRADEAVKDYRSHMNNLEQFAKKNQIDDKALHRSMQEHLEMHLEYQNTSDEALLDVYPTTIRRRILRHLYLKKLLRCYLFLGCSKKFLDALLALARVETFLPQIELLSEGESAHELSMLVSGAVEVLALKSGGDSIRAGTKSFNDPSKSSRYDLSVRQGGGSRNLSPGDLFGEASFFTETPVVTPIVSRSMCSVLVVARSSWMSLARDHAVDVRRVLENLQGRCEQEVIQAVSKAGVVIRDIDDAGAKLLLHKLAYSGAGALMGTPLQGMDQAQVESVSNLVHMCSSVANHVAMVETAQTTEFLGAAARGDMDALKKMLIHGHNVNAVDYDKRSALMVAASKGEPALLELLLDAGANPALRDITGSTALLDSCKHGNDAAIRVLRKRGSSLQGLEPELLVGLMCQSVFQGDNRRLQRMVQAGADASLGDWDNRTPLHIAAAEGNKEGVRILVEEGDASIEVKDRWGNTPLDDAQRVGARPVVLFLMEEMKRRSSPPLPAVQYSPPPEPESEYGEEREPSTGGGPEAERARISVTLAAPTSPPEAAPPAAPLPSASASVSREGSTAPP